MSRSDRSRHREVAKILSGPGGASHPVLESAGLLGMQLAVACDTSQELGTLKLEFAGAPIKSWPLADQDTLASLLQNTPSAPALREALGHRVGIGLGAGLGQIPAIGHLAGVRLVRSAEFSHWLQNDLLQQLLKAYPAGLKAIEHYQIIGGCGATAQGAHPPIEQELVHLLAAATGARVHQRKFLIGLPAYLGLGERVVGNAGSATAEALDWVVRNDRATKETRLLVCMDLPNCGQNDALRHMYTKLTFTAAWCHAVETLLDRITANASLCSDIGPVVIQQADYFRALTDVEIAAEVAQAYLPEIAQLRGAPVDPDLVRGLKVALQTQRRPRPSIEELVEEIAEKAVDQIVAAVCEPGETLSASVVAELASGDCVAVDRLQEDYLGVCRTPTALQQRLTLMRSLTRTLKREVTFASERCAESNEVFMQAEARLERATLALQSPPWWAFWKTPAQGELGFLDRARQAREAADVRLRDTAEHRALLTAAAAVEQETQHLSEQLTRLEDSLQRIAHGAAISKSPCINPISLDENFLRLQEAIRDPAEAAVFQLAAHSAESLTLDGLAKTLDAASPRLADVIEAIRCPHFAVEGPVWGCQPVSVEAPLQITVLPPVSAHLAANLQRYLQDVDPQRLVAIADTAQTGVIGAVRLSYRFPRIAADVLTPILRHAVAQALAAQRDLLFPRGTEHLQRLGFIVGDESQSDVS
ncbi:MAG: hypothetical protein K1X74_06215 [Pirellulales bacterium]|nr:hypothetical protein [Pirellulales bacterium]